MSSEAAMEPAVAFKDRYIIMVIVLASIMMAVIDGNVVSIALPTITSHFNVDVSLSQWTITSYLLTMTGLLLFFGKISEYTGKVHLFIAGIVIFTIGSLACGLSSSMLLLIGCRVLQGFGAAMMFSISGAILFQAFPDSERGRAMGFLGSAVAIGSIAGPVLGGIVVELLGWEYIFLINVPIGVVLLALAFKYLKMRELKAKALDMDWPGSAVLLVFMVALLLCLGDLGNNVTLTPITIALAVIAVLAMGAFIYRESHCEKPLLDLSIFRIKKFSLPVISMMLSFIASFMLSIIGPFYFQGVLQYSPSQVGILYLVTPIVMVVAAPITGMLYDRTRSKYYAFIGMLISAVSYIAFGMMASNFNLILAVAIFILMGIGGSLFQSPNNLETMSALPPRKIGIASSVTSTVRNLGMALGVSFGAILVTFQLSTAGYGGPILQAGTTLIPVISNIMYACGALCIVAAVISLIRNM